jgi:tetratricopeptide (TPR) repeat protein
VSFVTAQARLVAAAPGDTGPAASADAEARSDQLLLRARTAFLGGRYAEADGLYATAIQRRNSAASEGDSLARLLYELGAVRKVEGRCDEGSDLVMRGIRILEASPHPEAQELSDAWRVLGATYYCGHMYSKAEGAYLRALDLDQHADAPRKAAIFESLASLGPIYQNLGKYRRAEEAYRTARAILEEDSQIDKRSRAFLLSNLGALLRAEGSYSESEAALRQGLAALEQDGDRDGVVKAYLLNNLAMVHMERKAYRDAMILLDKAAALIQAGAAVPPADAAPLLRNYAVCLRKTGRKDTAKEVQVQAEKLDGNVPPDRERGLVTDVVQLARGK